MVSGVGFLFGDTLNGKKHVASEGQSCLKETNEQQGQISTLERKAAFCSCQLAFPKWLVLHAVTESHWLIACK